MCSFLYQGVHSDAFSVPKASHLYPGFKSFPGNLVSEDYTLLSKAQRPLIEAINFGNGR